MGRILLLVRAGGGFVVVVVVLVENTMGRSVAPVRIILYGVLALGVEPVLGSWDDVECMPGLLYYRVDWLSWSLSDECHI